MNKAYKYRILPTAEQKVLFVRTFGCVRFIYNRMLADKIAHYKNTGKVLHTTPAAYKKEFPWLTEVDSLALCNAQLQMETAYKNFFRDPKIGFPNFRSRKSGKNTYTTNCINGNISIIDDRFLKLPKVGLVKIKLHRQIPEFHKIKSVTISMEPSGKFYASVLTEYDWEIPAAELDRENALGLDYSSPHFYVDSEGHCADMPHYYRLAQTRLRKEQRKLSKMVRGSSNYRKQKTRVAKLHEKVHNQRRDWQHKESRRIADSWDFVCVEDINYQGMAQGLHLAKSTNDNAFGQFRAFLTYKLVEQGKRIITINKWFPSSKTCHHCGYIHSDLALSDRTWVCPCCGAVLDRDINAALNIREQGLLMTT